MNRENRILKEILIDLHENWKVQSEDLKKRMQVSNIVCTEIENSQIPESRAGASVLITDQSCTAVSWKKKGGISIGCIYTETTDEKLNNDMNKLQTSESGFFDGAELVTDSLEELDEQILEETLLHGLGLPVTIAETERLIIKEITKDEVEKLYQMSLQEGMQYLMRDSNGDNCFEPERMCAYIKTAYRFYGYGLWSVWTKQGELVGCCGLSDFVYSFSEIISDDEKNTEDNTYLELQYMVDKEYRRKGYALEMCSAVLDYAFFRTEWEEVVVRIHPENIASICLAEKLGFLLLDDEEEKQKLYLLKKENWISHNSKRQQRSGACGNYMRKAR